MAGRILVVEDDLLNRMFYGEVLRSEGFETLGLDDAADALEQAHDFRPDLIVTDINLPTVSGIDLIHRIMADDGLRAIPILAITAYASRQDEQLIREAGAKGYLSKPVSVADLMAAIGRLLPGQ